MKTPILIVLIVSFLLTIVGAYFWGVSGLAERLAYCCYKIASVFKTLGFIIEYNPKATIFSIFVAIFAGAISSNFVKQT